MRAIRKSGIASCAHHYCYECLLRWCTYSNECPKCREPIYELRADPEFDALLQDRALELADVALADAPQASGASDLEVTFDRNTFPGITLTKVPSTPGVLVKQVNANDRAYKCGLRCKDVLISLNGVPCTTHEHAIDIFNRAAQSGRSVRCTFLRK